MLNCTILGELLQFLNLNCWGILEADSPKKTPPFELTNPAGIGRYNLPSYLFFNQDFWETSGKNVHETSKRPKILEAGM